MSLRIGLVGCGTIGTELSTAILDGTLDCRLACVLDPGGERCAALIERFDADPPMRVETVAELVAEVDLVVEAASQAAVAQIGVPVLAQGRDLLVLSVGALADAPLRRRLFETADRSGATIHIPSGAIAGLDAVKAAALTDGLDTVSLTTTKPPAGLAGAPYLVENDIDLSGLTDPRVVFEGVATVAAKAFPSNINVAMALSLAGIGPDKTRVRIIADPTEETNVHRIDATGTVGEIHTEVRNVPSPTNPKTSYLAALSAIEKLRSLEATVRVGT
ncbi:aspartate dehydrogenase [Haladaptatus sp. DJG-WS-42]|uniref:aspartate dehydrogenase n=1 Tax=Haladaptatus sp. DJG-WS-42 TaxID=3120516 RepID=UPI0030D4F7C2